MVAERIEGVVQHYAWGDTEFLPKLLGREPDGEPWAELWLGTHPNGPTTFADGTALSTTTGDLPYLLKVLCAGQPLSLQAHPTPEQASVGHERGVYSDPNAKPELLVALTAFEALCGFRPYGGTIEYLQKIGLDALAEVVQERGADTLTALYRDEVDVTGMIESLDSASDRQARWAHRLGRRYGMDDPSVIGTLLMNYVRLRPGEALHLTAGNLHAYLHGSGIELMGASDNVVRGGLTAKEVDIELLLDTVDPSPLRKPIMEVSDGRYPLPEADVVLVRLEPGTSHTAVGHELTIALDGSSFYLAPGTQIAPTEVTFVVTPL